MTFSLLVLRARKLLWLVVRPRWWGLLRAGVAPSLEHRELLAGQRFRTIVDIGANVGQFALWAQWALDPELIVCVEPLESSAVKVRALANLANCAIEVSVVALGDAPADATLFVTDADDNSSLLRPVTGAGGNLAVAGTETVPVMVGDDLLRDRHLERPLLVKIDVQGTEDRVLRGLVGTLEHADAVLVEVSFVPIYEGQAVADDVTRFLLDQGFVLAGGSKVPGTHGTWQLEQADLLFVRPVR